MGIAADDNSFIFVIAGGPVTDNQAMGIGTRLGPGVAAATALAAVVFPAGAAGAHVGGQQAVPDATYYRSSLTRVLPAPAGVSVRVDPAGDFIELTNTGATDVAVLGYTGEPYLRVTATVVAENALSQTTYLNRSLFADSVPTGQDTGSVAPMWRQIGATGTVRWHDHRIHWMGQQRPPAVQADPGHPHLVGAWQVHASAGATRFDIFGELRWTGKPDTRKVPEWLLWLAESLAVVSFGLLTAFLLRQRRPAGSSGEPPVSGAGRAPVPGGR
ncbi:MAG: hypothetical protein V7603_4949 [Micromonosporaceae bacterium]